MANEERFVVLMHYRGSIKKKTRSGIKFTDKDPLSIFLKPSTSFNEFLNSIIQKLGLQGVKRVEKLLYGIPISVLQDDVKYNSLVIGSDEDLEVLFHCRQQFPEVRTPELLAKLVDVVSSSGGSNRNPQAVATAACSTSRPNEDDDMEPDMIADKSGEDIVGSNPVGSAGGSGSGTQQYPPHFFTLDLDAMR
ncbi:hypothetical protein Ahy_B03g065312 isoform E [Arachis hypogaea]|uniref:PB1 domain-containing protein n=1 Tax=Arachis hypogaea TaxID=3818 RepID=A0A445A1A3_ARAHY|nr:hypothetical protein Ahy_B03g065312 isoform E [Arachis hypogaea]